jgi:lysophospholipase L1-like esterase
MKSFLPKASTLLRFKSIVVFLSILMESCLAQCRLPEVEITSSDTVDYAFIHQEENILENSETLSPLFNKMFLQRSEGGHTISIVHIGDSHILGDYLTGEVRERIQREFGNAGRGLLFPYKLAQSNGPKDYVVETNCRWVGSSCPKDRTAETNFGVSGFRLETNNVKGILTLKLRNHPPSEVPLFTKVTIFQKKNTAECDLVVRDNTTSQIAKPFIADEFSSTYFFDKSVDQVTIAAQKNNHKQTKITIDGVSFENEQGGVIYHSIGVNGAKFTDFARAGHFARQVADLEPDLVILSFGTNEGQGKTYDAQMRQTMNNLTSKILESCPTTIILMTTPADSYLRGKGNNPYLNEMSKLIRTFALEKGFALWDLHLLTGGENSAVFWKQNNLLASDAVHYSKLGYMVQGKLLFQAIIKAYNNFIETKQ